MDAGFLMDFSDLEDAYLSGVAEEAAVVEKPVRVRKFTGRVSKTVDGVEMLRCNACGEFKPLADMSSKGKGEARRFLPKCLLCVRVAVARRKGIPPGQVNMSEGRVFRRRETRQVDGVTNILCHTCNVFKPEKMMMLDYRTGPNGERRYRSLCEACHRATHVAMFKITQYERPPLQT